MNYKSEVPSLEITENGIKAPDEGAIVAGVLNDFNNAFGGNLNITNVGTPQAYLAGEFAYTIANKNAEFIALANNFDPSVAVGRWLDALAQIYFIERRPATSTIVNTVCTGVPNTLLPEGSMASDTNGVVYKSLNDAVFGASGTASVNFKSTVNGAIECPSGTLTKIVLTVAGWDAVTNPKSGIIGTDEENDRNFEARRYASTAKNAQGSIYAVMGSVSSVQGVSDVFVTENVNDTAITVGSTNYSLKPHSVYLSVVGGSDKDVAEMFWRNKNAGSNMNGNTKVVVLDTSSYVYPYPKYDITFQRPKTTEVFFQVNIVNNVDLPNDITSQVQQAVIDVFTGKKSNAKARIGGWLYSSSYFGEITKISDFVNIQSVYVGLKAKPTATSVQFGIDQAPTVSSSTIEVVLV